MAMHTAHADDVASERDMKPFGEMPSVSGFSGFVIVGAGHLDVESNTIAGNDIIDVGNTVIESVFESPSSES